MQTSPYLKRQPVLVYLNEKNNDYPSCMKKNQEVTGDIMVCGGECERRKRSRV